MKAICIFFLVVTAVIMVKCQTESTSSKDGRLSRADSLKKHFILDKEGKSFILTRKCGRFRELTINDTVFEIQTGNDMAGVAWYRIDKIDSTKMEKSIVCNAMWVNVGHLDTNIKLNVHYKELNFRMTRFIIHKTDYENTIDTVYTTKAPFVKDYKIVDIGCEKKAHE